MIRKGQLSATRCHEESQKQRDCNKNVVEYKDAEAQTIKKYQNRKNMEPKDIEDDDLHDQNGPQNSDSGRLNSYKYLISLITTYLSSTWNSQHSKTISTMKREKQLSCRKKTSPENISTNDVSWKLIISINLLMILVSFAACCLVVTVYFKFTSMGEHSTYDAEPNEEFIKLSKDYLSKIQRKISEMMNKLEHESLLSVELPRHLHIKE
uniref:uncharacterized protein LOC120339141 isoform X1 n=1 Tax=Styela clava TaxID=7725 RepID=UPI00193AB40D|nr:uncharacterized protein LOC120339141 isoform X1 [Styela clava]